jgi:N-acetylglucosamine-6-sulfatase
MRVPFMAHCPSLFEGGQSIDKVVANIDIGPTVLHAAGLETPPQMQGQSFYNVMTGSEDDWRDSLLYEYYWERNFPHTPTMQAIRTDRWKFIRYVGIWDTDELYDMHSDPLEQDNLINSEKHQQLIRQLKDKLFAGMEATGGMQVPLYPDRGGSQNLRLRGRDAVNEFPHWFYRDEPVNREAR